MKLTWTNSYNYRVVLNCVAEQRMRNIVLLSHDIKLQVTRTQENNKSMDPMFLEYTSATINHSTELNRFH